MATILLKQMVLAILLTAAAMAGGQATAADSLADKPQSGIKPQGPDGATQVASFDFVAWDGSGASLDQLKGKTVLALTYVTWCPKCNLWAPEKLNDVKQAIAGKPVVVLAISTDVPPARAREYMTRRGFVGPNIFHGSDPQLAKTFGFTNEFFNYAIFDAKGELATSGNFGSGFIRGNEGDKPVAKAALELTQMKNLGKFRFIDPKMSTELQDTLWPMELGQVAALQKGLRQAEKSLKTSDRDLMKQALNRFLTDELAEASQLAEGGPRQKIEALEKASFLANQFKAAQEGKEAKRLVSDLTKDKSLKKEISAKKMYELSMQADDADRRLALLEKAARQFPDTHYGELAGKAAAAGRQ